MPRLQINETLRVREYILSDPSNIYYTEYYTTLKETSSADWQQQMITRTTYSTTLDHTSNRLHHNTHSFRPLTLLDDYHPITQTLTTVSTPIGTLIPTINVTCISTTNLINNNRTQSQIFLRLTIL